MDDSVIKVRRSVKSALIPLEKIRKHPLKSIGIALFVGFVIGLPGRKSRKEEESEKKQEQPQAAAYQPPGFTRVMMNELKGIAAKRAANYFASSVDRNLFERIQNGAPRSARPDVPAEPADERDLPAEPTSEKRV